MHTRFFSNTLLKSSLSLGHQVGGGAGGLRAKGKTKGDFKLPTVEGTIDLRSPSPHIGLDADLSPSGSRSRALGVGGTWDNLFIGPCLSRFSMHTCLSMLHRLYVDQFALLCCI